MSIWDDIGEQTGVWTGYAGLSPEEALQKWYRTQQSLIQQGYRPGQQGPGGEILGSMEGLSRDNPAAFKLVSSGRNYNKQADTHEVFDPINGTWKTVETKGYWNRPESWIQLAAAGGAAVAAPAAIASGAQGATAAPTAAGVASTPGAASLGAGLGPEVGTGTLYGGTGGTLGALGSSGTAAAGGSTLSKLAPYLIAGGTDLAGGILGSRAANKASQQQLAAGREAMGALGNAYGQQLGFYGQQRDVYAPYNQIGQSALGNLARLTGSPAPQAPAPNPTMVRLRAPDGSVQAVPSEQVQHYIQRGAQVV